MLTCCLTVTIITVMVMGIGIGFHYCFVQNSVESMEKAAVAVGALRSGPTKPTPGHVLRSLDKAVQRGFAHRVARREADSPPESYNNNTVFYKLFGYNSSSIDNRITSLVHDIY
ncbi:unnamed protein product, partial [Leptidea sinapis]